ncbi:ammonia channel [Arthrobacter sp. Hiyo4]|nr:ammonia channel [Arthrobacter sp. Hiyo4]
MAVLVTVVLSGGVTLVIGRAINRTIGFRVSHEAEMAGVDLSEHAETAYAFGGLGSHFNPLGRGVTASAAAPAKEDTFA